MGETVYAVTDGTGRYAGPSMGDEFVFYGAPSPWIETRVTRAGARRLLDRVRTRAAVEAEALAAHIVQRVVR